MRFLFAFIFVISITFSQSLKDISTLGPCTAQLDDGRKIDLSSLDNPSQPRTAVNGGFSYKFNPCSSIDCGGKQSSICQVYNNGADFFVLGEQPSAYFSLAQGKVQINYSKDIKKSVLTCSCVPSGSPERFVFERESPTNNYFLTFESPCCCPDGCVAPPPQTTTPGSGTTKKNGGGSGGGITFGTILTIIFFVCLTCYCVSGVLFMKYRKGATGIELIPNIAVWQRVTSDIKGGFRFTVGKIRPSSGYQSV